MNTTTLRQQLVNLSTASGGHKEQADRYRALLEQIFQQKDGSQIELLQQYIEASELCPINYLFHL
jgi:hypothetical protein